MAADLQDCTGVQLPPGAKVAVCSDIQALKAVDTEQNNRLTVLENAGGGAGVVYKNCTGSDLPTGSRVAVCTDIENLEASINYLAADSQAQDTRISTLENASPVGIYYDCDGGLLDPGASVARCQDLAEQDARITALEDDDGGGGLEYLNTTLDLSVMPSPVGETQFANVGAAISYVMSHFVFGPLAKIRITDYRTGTTEVLSFQGGSGVSLTMFTVINEGDVTYTVSGHGRLPRFKVNKLGTIVLHPGSELIVEKALPGNALGAALSITSLSMTGATLHILGELDGEFGDTAIAVQSKFSVYDGSRIFSVGKWTLGASVSMALVVRSEFNNRGNVLSNASVYIQDSSRWHSDLLDMLNNKRPYVISSEARIGTIDISGASFQLSMATGSRVSCSSYLARGGTAPTVNTVTSSGIFTAATVTP